MWLLTRRKSDKVFLNLEEQRGGGLLMIRKFQTRHTLKHIGFYGTLQKRREQKTAVKITNFNHSDIPKLSEDKLKFFGEDLTKKIYIIF